MALVDIDEELKERVQARVAKDGVEYPSMKNFVDRAIKAQLTKLETMEKKTDEKEEKENR